MNEANAAASEFACGPTAIRQEPRVFGTHARKWAAFYLSLLVPGAGQAWLHSAWCLAWWLAVGLTAGAWHGLAFEWGEHGWFAAARTTCFLAWAWASASHAQRLAEGDRPWPPTPGVRSRVKLGPRRGRSLAAQIDVTIPAPQAEVWKRVADLPRFLLIDTFHDRITLMRPIPEAGVDVVLSHNAFGWRFLRFGRILHWREGSGYAFSDLSPRGSRAGFPHVFFITLEAATHAGREATLLRVAVRGKWNSRTIPVWLGRLWVAWVSRDHARLLRKAM